MYLLIRLVVFHLAVAVHRFKLQATRYRISILYSNVYSILYICNYRKHNRKQSCSVNGQRSLVSEVACGIPQDSCLGPVLSIIYLNDFKKCLEFSRASVYADDTTITIVSNDVEKLLCEAQQELLNLSEWMRINKLSPNPAKTEYMIIGHSRKLNKLDI